MSIGEHRHCCVTFKIFGFVWEKKPIVSVTYKNERISIKKQLTLLKMCITSLLCGPRVDLWPFYGFLCKTVFSLYEGLPRCSPMLIFRAWATCGSTILKFYLRGFFEWWHLRISSTGVKLSVSNKCGLGVRRSRTGNERQLPAVGFVSLCMMLARTAKVF